MPLRKNANAFFHAKFLRQNPSRAELILWNRLRRHQLNGVGFRRQHPIGPYIADFCAPRNKLIIELDGNHHRTQQEYDKARSEYLHTLGFFVLRFWNDEVENGVDKVIQKIVEALKSQMKNSAETSTCPPKAPPPIPKEWGE